jgi:hypothetical protein
MRMRCDDLMTHCVSVCGRTVRAGLRRGPTKRGAGAPRRGGGSGGGGPVAAAARARPGGGGPGPGGSPPVNSSLCL